MSDMFSHSFKQYQDLKRQEHVDDMEVGGGVGNKTIILDKFFYDVENVKDDMLVVQNLYKKDNVAQGEDEDEPPAPKHSSYAGL
ncbi:hypothetical protein L1987_68835 [Smallanthus sonchifolius]|uniref:Uncharacterized protein n=1 Tax=Smallanthus sonchifolius TaxID=185202 RepID=A0ACB9B5E6_9ASTR|nr:hypothetical protein L1987_68835 [Smallanthus sonchifolius]